MNRNNRPPRVGAPAAGQTHGNRDKAKSRATEIIYHDDALFVVNKAPGDWPEDSPTEEPAVVERIVSESTGPDAVLPVYPLEDAAAGILLLACGAAVHRQLEQQLLDRRLEFRYLALVRGRPLAESGSINRPLLDNRKGGGIVNVDDEHGQPAVTDWRVLDTFIEFALLECVPRTLVPNQIRAHLGSIGMPLAVDRPYGGGAELRLSSFKADYRPSRRREERPLIARLTLHAQSVSFTHPATNEQMRFEAAPPKDFRAALHQLDRFGRVPR